MEFPRKGWTKRSQIHRSEKDSSKIRTSNNWKAQNSDYCTEQQDQWHLKPRKDIKLSTSKIKISEHICYIKGETTPITIPKNIAIANTVALQKQLLTFFWIDINTLQHQQQSHSPCIQCWSNSRLLHPKISSLMRKLSRDSVQCHWGWRCCLESPH